MIPARPERATDAPQSTRDSTRSPEAESHLDQVSKERADTDADDRTMAIIIRTVGVLGVSAAVAVGYFAGRGAGASAAYGATLGIANLVLLGRMVRSFLGRGGASTSWVAAAMTKLAVLVLAMYLPVRAGLVQVLPFVIGFGALPLGIALGQLLSVPPKSREN